LLAICFGRIGNIPRLATTSTQALIEKCIVRPSNHKEFAVLSVCDGWEAAVDLALDPESRALTFSLDGVAEDLAAGLVD
jgi:hypothetical protein